MLVALIVLGGSRGLNQAAVQGAALWDSGQLPTSPVVSENVHPAAIVPVGGDVLGICDDSMTAAAVSAGASPFVLVRRDAAAAFVAVLPGEYVVMRVSTEQRGCLPVPTPTPR